MKINIFLLAHQDDEIAILKSIKTIIEKNERIYIFFLTNGNNSKYNDNLLIKKREKESKKVLSELGVNLENVIFLGNLLKIKSYKLINKLDKTYQKLSKFINNINGKITIYSHAWEGGNIDHDSTFILTLKLIRNYSKILTSYQFPFYNSYKMSLNFYRIFYPISENGRPLKLKISLYEKVKFIKYLFYYTSQSKIWLALYPFVIMKILLNNFNYLQPIKKRFILNRPHENLLWYEKRKFIKYKKAKKIFEKFLLLK